jgi:hypothetical protein
MDAIPFFIILQQNWFIMSLKIWALSLFLKIWALSPLLYAQDWIPDLGNGKYKNPIIYADYSDPDVIRVDDNFYMVASSFNCMPGIPVLKSGDLDNNRPCL